MTRKRFPRSGQCPPRDRCQQYLEVFCRDEVEAVARIYKTYVTDRERRTAIGKIITHLRQSGAYRALPCIPQGWRRRLDDLEALFPNFGEYISFLRTTYALAEREGRHSPHCEPVLLNGPPGIGKSLVIQHVVDFMGVRSQTFRLESAQAGADLQGTAEYWGNSQPGRLAKELIFGSSAAPVFVLEEIDKVSAREYSPLNSLYELLESDSAATYHDQALPWLGIRASRVIWVSASNSIDTVPAPILSRLKVIEIPAPTPEQTLTIATEIWRRLRADWPVATANMVLTDDALYAAASHPPRIIRKGLREAVGRAVYDGRNLITADDINACMGHVQQRRPCGFL
ncbi:AAA family ATPase [Noviherbaspirillum malthae]|uniref:AAA family ATPase n=1 Tax=Noviherbaspirillum malthae TaxID=1260987 RepID=UPI00188DCAE2|nr:AAA family ATPase [Noviherbaspirillum malthae]